MLKIKLFCVNYKAQNTTFFSVNKRQMPTSYLSLAGSSDHHRKGKELSCSHMGLGKAGCTFEWLLLQNAAARTSASWSEQAWHHKTRGPSECGLWTPAAAAVYEAQGACLVHRYSIWDSGGMSSTHIQHMKLDPHFILFCPPTLSKDERQPDWCALAAKLFKKNPVFPLIHFPPPKNTVILHKTWLCQLRSWRFSDIPVHKRNPYQSATLPLQPTP